MELALAQDGCFNEKSEGQKSHDTVPLKAPALKKWCGSCSPILVLYIY
jgi:hypothetical protein